MARARLRNTHFQFKQFRIEQDRCAMKVSTEACIFGAWIATVHKTRILDIGTGTGLLSLMMAQRCEALIDAVEIESEAYSQALENFSASPWSNQMHAIHTAIQDYASSSEMRYDLIVSNPPFYEDHTPSPESKINLARHGRGLSYESLVNATFRLLADEGKFEVLLPHFARSRMDDLCASLGLVPEERLLIANTLEHSPRSVVTRYGRSSSAVQVKEALLPIRKAGGEYSGEFVDLLKAYYLHL